MGAGKGWTAEESVTACKSFTAASEDPQAGSGKKKDVFLGQVLDVYDELMLEVKRKNPQVEYPARTGDAVAQRHRKAKCESLKFEGIIASIKAKNPTGSPSEEDITRAAQAVYNGDATIANMYTYFRDSSVDAGAQFPFLDCLWYLRQTISWQFIVSSKQKKREKRIQESGLPLEDGMLEDLPSTPEGVADPPINSPHATRRAAANIVQNNEPTSMAQRRPKGSKRALESTKQYHALIKGASGIESLAQASQKRNKVAEEMLSVEKQQSLVALFSMPGTDSVLRERFIQLSQQKAIALLESELATTARNDAVGEDRDDRSPFHGNSNAEELDSMSPGPASQSVLSLLN